MKNEEATSNSYPNLYGQGKNSFRELIKMILMGLLGTFCWITLFSLGLLINSEPYRLIILKQFELGNFVMSILTYTPTNIAVLCIIAAFSGGCSSRLVIGGVWSANNSELESQNSEEYKTESHIYMMENPFSSMIRGLVVYLAILAGVFVTNSNAFTNTTPQAYGELAGIASLISFVVGYDPSSFRSLISISDKIKPKPK